MWSESQEKSSHFVGSQKLLMAKLLMEFSSYFTPILHTITIVAELRFFTSVLFLYDFRFGSRTESS